MMTGLVSAGAPLPTTATLLEGGETVDPSGGETFLAALAAAVAVPAPTPAPSPMMIVVVEPDAMPPSDDAALDASDEADVSLTATELPAGEGRGEAVSAPRRITVKTDPPSAAAPVDVRRAEKPREEKSEAAESAAPAEPPARTESADNSAVPADADVRLRTPGQGDAMVPAPATPSIQASAHALAAPPRQSAQGGEPPASDAPSARPAPAGPSTSAMRQPAPSASATAAGVLAAMHAARESSVMPPAVLPDEMRAAVATNATVVAPAASGRAPSEPVPDASPAMVEPMGTPDSTAPRGERVVARPVVVVADDGGAGSAGQRAPDHGAERDRPRLVVTADATAEPTLSPRTPFAVGAPSPGADSAPTVVTLPDAAPAADAPPARVATSHVTVELDVEQSGAERVRVAVRGDVVHATVVTDRGGVDAMRPQLDQLRHALEGQGFREAHVQVRSSGGEATGALAPGGVADLRPRAEAASRTPDGSSSEQQQPRGRHRGQDQSPPEGRHHEHEEEIL
jgi:hypothetical protein